MRADEFAYARAYGERMCACVIPRAGLAAPTLAELVTYLRGQDIATFKLPRSPDCPPALRSGDAVPEPGLE
jgi:non-ribosomal peptide synthetase component E (peptide arylation enzyme)